MSASPVETKLIDTYSVQFAEIEDQATLWKIHDVLTKQIRKNEKNMKTKARKPRDPNAPKKAASAELNAWNEQVKRIVELSKKSTGGELAYNHCRAVGTILKNNGLLVVSKANTVIPTDEEIINAVNTYHEEENPGPVPPKKTSAKKEPAKAKVEETEEVEQEFNVETYTFIINGKSYDRADNDGHAFIWDQKGVYMGVYDEKTKKFDLSIPDPTA